MTSYTVPIPEHLPAAERILLTEALEALTAYTDSGMASDMYDAKRCVSVLWAWAAVCVGVSLLGAGPETTGRVWRGSGP